MKYYFLSGLFPDNLYDWILRNSRGNINFAADALQKSLVEGFSEVFDNIEILNIPFMNPYPKGFKKCYVHRTESEYITKSGKRVSCHNLPFCNFLEYQKTSICNSICHEVDSLMRKIPNETICLLVYGISMPFAHASYKLKKKFGDRIKIVLIVTDMPQFTADLSKRWRQVLWSYQSKLYEKYYHAYDGFVLLSKYMKELLPVNDKPWTVVEGIFNPKDDVKKLEESNKVILFYGGSMATKYGVTNLVDAFMQIHNDEYILRLCGSGDAVPYIKSCAERDRRIEYLGVLPRPEALKHQRSASLLINPRTPEGEYTKYSFPSKTMEYLASGIPTLLYELPGIPEEYYDHCFTIRTMGVDALRTKMEEILNMAPQIMKQKGLAARSFILDYKNPYRQCAKIKDIIDKL